MKPHSDAAVVAITVSVLSGADESNRDSKAAVASESKVFAKTKPRDVHGYASRRDQVIFGN